MVASHDPIELSARVATCIASGDPDKPTDAGGPTKSEANLEYLLSVVTANPFPSEPNFPTPEVTNVVYPLAAGGTTEADIVVLCDDVVLVVECKAARLDPATKRGADRKIVADLEATITGGLRQAERFVRELASRGTMTVIDGRTKQTIALDGARFRHLMRVNVTLELINVVSTQLWQLQAAV